MIFDIIRDCSILTSSTSRTQNCMVCEYPINTLNYNTLYSFNILHVHQFLLASLMHFFDLKALITMILATLAVQTLELVPCSKYLFKITSCMFFINACKTKLSSIKGEVKFTVYIFKIIYKLVRCNPTIYSFIYRKRHHHNLNTDSLNAEYILNMCLQFNYMCYRERIS